MLTEIATGVYATWLRFDLPEPGPVRLEVFDLLGRRVARVAEGDFPAGSHGRAWDLRGEDGVSVPPGIYIGRMSAGTFRAKTKIGVVP